MIKEKLIIVITGKLRIKITCYLQLKCLGSLIIYYSTFVYFFLAIKSSQKKHQNTGWGLFRLKITSQDSLMHLLIITKAIFS